MLVGSKVGSNVSPKGRIDSEIIQKTGATMIKATVRVSVYTKKFSGIYLSFKLRLYIDQSSFLIIIRSPKQHISIIKNIITATALA